MERLFLVPLRVLIIRVLIINSFDDSFLCNVEWECDPSSLAYLLPRNTARVSF